MAFDVSPTSERWKEIVNMVNENAQGRAIRRYVYELERKISSQEAEIRELKRKNEQCEQYRKDVLSLDFVKEAIEEAVRKAEDEVFDRYNTNWSGFQGGL